MKTRVIPIGNSKGIRIPRSLLELCRIRNSVNLEVKGDIILIRPIKDRPRAGWDSAFRTMHEQHDDRLLIDASLDVDVSQWEW
ncbi:MAG: AbrB/MazE/SpoVT family DNA-binding domain-containing protein [Candidatus Omnitrophica bacterium]|nr:AbrB/MazE/SpoVT family DNA-binding domain-containing protein [Candidatus Omnitrophota bacterium]